MIAKRKLRIKIAIPLDDSGQPLDEDQVDSSGIFHQKVGLLTDDLGDSISFSGSINETAYAWIHNIEEFKVYKGWEASQSDYFQSDVQKINKYWNGDAERTRVIDIPKAIEEKLISMAPERVEALRLRNPRPRHAESQKSIELRDYQKEAIRRWSLAGFKGILSMATGTGKTIVALHAVKNHLPKNTLVESLCRRSSWQPNGGRKYRRRSPMRLPPNATPVEMGGGTRWACSSIMSKLGTRIPREYSSSGRTIRRPLQISAKRLGACRPTRHV